MLTRTCIYCRGYIYRKAVTFEFKGEPFRAHRRCAESELLRMKEGERHLKRVAREFDLEGRPPDDSTFGGPIQALREALD